jgi:hypothetical protein
LTFVVALAAGGVFTTASLGECVRDKTTENSANFFDFTACAAAPRMLMITMYKKTWEEATEEEKTHVDVRCALVKNWAQRVYGITEADSALKQSSGVISRLFMDHDDDGAFPAALLFECSDGRKRMLVALKLGYFWLQFPERFARAASGWLGGPPPAPESGHRADWVPDDLIVIDNHTPDEDGDLLPPGTIVRGKSGKVYRLD